MFKKERENVLFCKQASSTSLKKKPEKKLEKDILLLAALSIGDYTSEPFVVGKILSHGISEGIHPTTEGTHEAFGGSNVLKGGSSKGQTRYTKNKIIK